MSTAEPAPGVADTGAAPAAEQEGLRAVLEALSGELELRPLLARLVRAACALLEADVGTIGLVDAERGEVRTAAIHHLPLDGPDAALGPGIGLAGEVMRTGRPLAVGRYGDLARPTQPLLLDHAVVGAPIVWRDRVIGVCGVGAVPPRCFNAQDTARLALFARHAAVAIVTARRYERERRRVERLALIARVGRLIAADLRLDDLLQTAADAIHELLGYPNVAIPLLPPDEPETLVLRTFGGHYRSIMESEYRIPITQGLMGAAARTRQVVLVNDVTTDPRYLPTPNAPDMIAELALPIVLGERVLGVLNIESSAPFDADDAAGLQIVADQLAVAIANARLFAAEQRRVARTLTITRIGRLITSRLSLDQLLATAVAAVAELFPGAHLALLLVDPERPDTLVLRARSGDYGDAAPVDYRQGLDEGIIGAAVRERRAILVDDVRRDPRYRAAPGVAVLRAELALPLVFGDDLLGALNIESERSIGAEDADGLVIMADQLSVAIHNAGLFDRAQHLLREARLVAETSQRIGTAMDVDGVITAYLEQVAARGRYVCTVVLFEFDSAGRRAGVVVWGRWSPAEGVTVLRTPRAPRPRDAIDPLLDAGETVAITDVHTDPRASAALRRVQRQDGRPALALIPLMARGLRLGLIILSAPRAQAWPEADLQPYQVTAALLAAAIDSRRQHGLVARRGQQLAVLEERRRLARELHDSVTQLVFGATLIAQTIGPAWRRDPVEGERRAARLLDLSQQALAEMRALLVELRPATAAGADETAEPAASLASPSLEPVRRRGLAAALRAHCARLARDDGPEITLDARGYVRQPVDREAELFRIAQEALVNVVKHAQARRVTVSLAASDSGVTLRVQDDGSGFAPGQADAPGRRRPGATGGFGLAGMRERASALGGHLLVHSAPGRGTTISLTLPAAPDGGA